MSTTSMENKPQIPSTPKVNISDAPWVKCSEGSMIYDNAVMFKRLSPIISPTGKEELVPMEAVICKQCGKIPKFFYDRVPDVPEDLKSTCTFDYHK